jgi:hypothetical protein
VVRLPCRARVWKTQAPVTRGEENWQVSLPKSASVFCPLDLLLVAELVGCSAWSGLFVHGFTTKLCLDQGRLHPSDIAMVGTTDTMHWRVSTVWP